MNSVEVNAWDRPVNYHFLNSTDTAASGGYALNGGAKHIIIPAAQIIHHYPIEHAGQTRGFSFLAPAGTRTKMLAAFENAAVIAKRVAASKMGFIIPDPENPPAAKYSADGEAVDGSTRENIEPGILECRQRRCLREVGWTLSGFDPASLADAGSLLDPFVSGIHPLRHVRIGDHSIRHTHSSPRDASTQNHDTLLNLKWTILDCRGLPALGRQVDKTIFFPGSTIVVLPEDLLGSCG